MLRILLLVLSCLVFWAVPSQGVPIAVFPLQDLGNGRNDVNLPLTRLLADYLAQNGNNIISQDAVIRFMANNRIRTVGTLESFNAFRVRDDLRAGFVLIGAVTQRKEGQNPTIAMTLSLVRTSDARTIWSYAGNVTTADERKVLGIGEPSSTDELQYLLLDEMLKSWPWQRINEVQEAGAVNIETVKLQPKYVAPGGEVQCKVHILDTWPVYSTPRIFFKVDDQIYPATVSDNGRTLEATWVAGEDNGSFPVLLLLRWAQYGRTETVLLGSYVIDGTPPFLEVELRGGKLYEGRPVFNREVIIVPKMIVSKQLARWRLFIKYHLTEGDTAFVGDMNGNGNLPPQLVWPGSRRFGDGTYEIGLEAWDLAGNMASASTFAEYSFALPTVEMAMSEEEDKITLDMKYSGKVPLRYWRLEMWTKEGRLLKEAEGVELPVTVGFKNPGAAPEKEITGFVFLQDALGKETRIVVEDQLPGLKRASKEKEVKKNKGVGENWVNDF